MISEFAVGDLEELRSEGLNPTVRDIIRLNALGLQIESERKRSPLESTNYLPRVAALNDKVSFRQPTVGHEVWLDKIERLVKRGDFETALAIKAYALSRPASELPDPDDPKSVSAAICAFCDEMKDFCRAQIFAAVEYVLYGADETVGELAERESAAEDEERELLDQSFALGSLYEGQVALYGITAADLKKMTRRQLDDLICWSYSLKGLELTNRTNERLAGYYRTLESIRERLKKEKDNGKQH